LSEALADTVTVPETVDPLAGAVMDTVGGVVSAAVLLTVTLTALDVVRFPAASRAMAVSVCEAFDAVVVFHDTVYGVAVSSEPRFTPSSWNWRPATPTLSAAFADTVIVPDTVDPPAGLVIEAVGGVVSPPPPPPPPPPPIAMG